MDAELSFETILRKDNNWLLFKQLYKDKLPENVILETEKMLAISKSFPLAVKASSVHAAGKSILTSGLK